MYQSCTKRTRKDVTLFKKNLKKLFSFDNLAQKVRKYDKTLEFAYKNGLKRNKSAVRNENKFNVKCYRCFTKYDKNAQKLKKPLRFCYYIDKISTIWFNLEKKRIEFVQILTNSYENLTFLCKTC